MQAGLNSFAHTPKQWNERTGAIGLISKAGRYGGTYAHKDIAFEFASWNLNRTLSKLNYRIHTDAIKIPLIPPEVTPAQASLTYATEADLLNVALFSRTARQWWAANPKLDGKMRDPATIGQLLVPANLEGLNAELIHMQLPQGGRLTKLNAIAIRQMLTLAGNAARLLEGE